nr:hypothetical protein [Tanacetum cinerariifolium]
MSYLSDFEELNGGYVTFGGNPKGGKISGKGKIKTVLLRVPRKNNMYNVNLKNIVPSGDLTCLFAKATIDESNLWHIRLAHINFKNINKLVKDNLVRGLPIKVIENDNTCVACMKCKQHRTSCKTKHATKDETSPIFKTFITGLEIQLSLKVEVIISDNETEFKNNDLNQFCGMKRIKRKFNVPKTPQQNGIAERKNKTLIEAARTMLTYSLVPIPFWAEAVNTACYVQNRTRIVQETLHVNFLENKPNIAGSGRIWLFDIDSLTRTMNYQPVTVRNQTNPSAGFQDKFDAEKAGEKIDQQYMFFPVWSSGSTNPQNNDGDATFDGKEHDFDAKKLEVSVSPSSSAQLRKQDDNTKKEAKGKSHVESFTGYRDLSAEFKDCSDNSINEVNAAGTIVPTVGQNSPNNTNTFSVADLEDITYSDDEDDVGAEADFNNLETSITVSLILTTRVHKDHVSQIIGDLSSTTQTRSMTRVVQDQGGLSQMFNDDFHTCMFVCFLSQEEPKRVHQALKYPSWIEAMQEELLQFKMQKVWVLVDLPHEKRVIGTKWVYRNKKDERGIVVRNKARLVAQGHTQEEEIDYEEVFAPEARIEAIRLFVAYASIMGFMVYQMDVQSAFIYETIEGEVYVYQPPGFEDPDHPNKVYKVVKALYGLHQALRAWYETLANYLLENGFQRGKMDQTLFIKRQKADERQVPDEFNGGTHIHFGFSERKSANTPIDTDKPLLKDPDGEDVDVHTYRLISWQCKKQTVVATLSTEAEYVATASCCAQVLWIQNQRLAYSHSPLLGVNTPRSDEDMFELIELTVFLLPNVEKVGIEVNVVDLQVSTVRHMLLLLVHKLLLFSLTNWYCSLSAVSSIKYDLTVNPNIYVSCIKQFWTTIAVKQVNDVTRLQALVDKKKVVITEAAIRDTLYLVDAEGVDCLPNEEIFAELARMGYEKPSTKLTFYKAFFSSQWKFLIHTILQCMSAKRTSWNEFNSSMAFAVICLSSGKRFSGVETTLFEGMLVEQQGDEEGDADEHVEEVNTGDVAEGDDSAAHGEVTTVAEEQSIPSPTPPSPPPQPPQDIPSTSQVQQTPPPSPQVQPPSPQPQPQSQQAADFPMTQALEITKLKKRVKKLEKMNKVRVLKLRRLQKIETSQRVETSDDTVMDDESNQRRMIVEMDQDDAVVLKDDKEENKEVADAVKDAEEAKVDESAQVQGRQAESQAKIYKIDMDHANKVLSMQEDETKPAKVQEIVYVITTAKLITEVVTAASETVTAASSIITTAEAQVPAATTATLTAAPARVAATPTIDHVKRKAKEDPTIKRYQTMKRKPQTEAQARKNMMMYLKNVAGFKLDYFKGMSYDDIRPIFEAKFNSNVDFLLKTKEQMKEEENRALQTINETPIEKAAKRRKLNEEVKELKRHLQIVPNKDDDVYTEATPLARKVPVVDYEIIEMNNKPYYKIIKANGTHQLYISFLTLLRNFDR